MIIRCAFAVLIFSFSGCRRTDVNIGHGYRLTRGYSEFHSVVREDDIEVIPANIESFGNEQDLFYGYLSPNEYVKYHTGEEVNYKGYFYLNKRSGKVSFGLSELEWKAELLKRGISNPVLTPTE